MVRRPRGRKAAGPAWSFIMIITSRIGVAALAISFLIPRPEGAETTSVAPQKETVR